MHALSWRMHAGCMPRSDVTGRVLSRHLLSRGGLESCFILSLWTCPLPAVFESELLPPGLLSLDFYSTVKSCLAPSPSASGLSICFGVLFVDVSMLMSFHPLCLWKGTLTADSPCVNVGLIPAIGCCVSKCHSCDYRFPLFLSGSHLSFSSCHLLFFLLLFFSLPPALLVIPLFSPSFLSPFLLSLCFSNTVFNSFVMSFAIHTWFVNELSGNYNHYFSLWNLFWIDANLISTIYTGSACRQLCRPPFPLCSLLHN